MPGTNLIAIPRYAPIDTAYVIVFKASAVLGIDTSFVITPLRNGRSIIVENNHSVKKGAGYAGIFAVIKQNSDSLFGQCVAVGDIVSLGQMLGKTGATGSVDGPHLHISMFVDTIPVNYFTLKQIL